MTTRGSVGLSPVHAASAARVAAPMEQARRLVVAVRIAGVPQHRSVGGVTCHPVRRTARPFALSKRLGTRSTRHSLPSSPACSLSTRSDVPLGLRHALRSRLHLTERRRPRLRTGARVADSGGCHSSRSSLSRMARPVEPDILAVDGTLCSIDRQAEASCVSQPLCRRSVPWTEARPLSKVSPRFPATS